jgi:uncharacterized protein DUF3237
MASPAARRPANILKQHPPRRSTFIDRTLLYLFSYDVEVERDPQTIGFFPGGVRFNMLARRNKSRAYNVMRDRTVAGTGVPAISGELDWGADWIFWREDDVEFSQVRMTITTDEGETIYSTYPVVAYLGLGNFRRLVSEKDKIGTEDEPVEGRFVTTPRFQTSSAAYLWINDLQCVGFGRLQLIRSEFRRISYDVYGLT